jgi:hypothetical protein
LAGGASFGIFFRAPDRPERRVIAFNTFVVRQNRFKQRENLQPLLAFQIPAETKEWPEINATKNVVRFQILLDDV